MRLHRLPPCTLPSVLSASQEVEATKRFRSPNIIRIFDSAVVQEGEGKLIYLFLPYYARGNVQDAINAHVVHGSSFAEKEMLAIFRGTCEAVKAMHTYRLPDVGAHRAGGRRPAQSSTTVDQERAEEGAQTGDQDQVPLMSLQGHAGADGTEDAEGSAYPPRPNPNPGAGKEVVRPALGGDGVEEGRGGEMVPYAHRDIKPA